MQDLAYGDHDESVEVVKNKICETTRWSICYDLVFKIIATGKYYSSFYSRGATECQDESPYEHSKAEVECPEVEPKLIEVTIYVEVKESTADESVPKVD